jgi:bifunctional DNA-binding transcriptional regulator/antitoxin component of YhaV-PrlF toxin-antitoxin module
MRLTSKCQVTIPQHIRDLAGLAPGNEIDFQFNNGRIWMEKVETSVVQRKSKIQALLNEVTGSAAANKDLHTDDILRLTRDED